MRKSNNYLSVPKHLTNPQARSKEIEGRQQQNYKVVATDDSGYRFEIYKRQNLRPGMEDDFSCGISWVAPNGETLTLARYNGKAHSHRNKIEKTNLKYSCHIHKATERYILANKKPEGFAEESHRYSSIDGAIHCLVVDCNISGLKTKSDKSDQIPLF